MVHPRVMSEGHEREAGADAEGPLTAGETVALPGGERVRWISESDAAPPTRIVPLDDRSPREEARRVIRQGAAIWWRGDYHRGRRLLDHLEERLGPRPRVPEGATLAERWRAEREARGGIAELLGRVLLVVEPDGSLRSRRAPDTRRAVELAWPEAIGRRAALPLRTLVGALGAAGWTDAGLEVPGLEGRLTPLYGVFSPTRSAYVRLLDGLGDVTGRSVLDVGCGTGVLSLVLLQRGARHALGVDIDPRAVRAARLNAERLGLADRFEARVADLFPEGLRADLIVFNPPWIPEAPRTRLDRAVFDPGGATLARFLATVGDHLADGGEAALLVSDLPERLGLRAPDAITRAARDAGLAVEERLAVPADHPRAHRGDDPRGPGRRADPAPAPEPAASPGPPSVPGPTGVTTREARAGERIRLLLLRPSPP